LSLLGRDHHEVPMPPAKLVDPMSQAGDARSNAMAQIQRRRRGSSPPLRRASPRCAEGYDLQKFSGGHGH